MPAALTPLKPDITVVDTPGSLGVCNCCGVDSSDGSIKHMRLHWRERKGHGGGAMPTVSCDNSESVDRLPPEPVNPTPVEAVISLRRFAINPETSRELTAAIAIMLDHVANLEMTLTLLRNGYESAMRNMPGFAIIDDGKKKM